MVGDLVDVFGCISSVMVFIYRGIKQGEGLMAKMCLDCKHVEMDLPIVICPDCGGDKIVNIPDEGEENK